jgi:glycosyltransferase involved in cell wall biosynthesis
VNKLPQFKWPFRDTTVRNQGVGGDSSSGCDQSGMIQVARNSAVVAERTAESERTAGDFARDRKNWVAAAAAYGRYLQLMPDDGAIWVQNGHMLKEAGLFNRADQSYDRAMKLLPLDPDVRVQRAILRKFQGDFSDAIRLFKEADSLGYSDHVFLKNEIEFISKTDNCRTVNSMMFSRSTSQFQIYLSSVVGAPRAETGREMGTFVGASHYSYAFALKGYLLGLEAMGLPYDIIKSPEYLPDIRGRSFSDVNLHFGFYPPDAPRLLKGAYNIFVTAWEFERLRRPQEQFSHHAFGDPVKMLRCADEVWMGSTFSADAVRNSGVDSVIAVPSPVLPGVLDQARRGLPMQDTMFRTAGSLDHLEWVPLSIVPGLQAAASQEATRRRSSLRAVIMEQMDEPHPIFFLSVLNVYDYRKQIKPVLEAFVRLAKVCPRSFLLLKVSFIHREIGDLNEFMYRHQINDAGELAPPLVSDRIWLTSEVLSRDDLNHLYDMSAFYVCSSHGEGQNLPLIEAMGRGVVPVSVNHTAMRDYISTENAIVIPDTIEPFSPRLRERYGMHDLNTHYVSAWDAYKALDIASGIDDETYARMSQRALGEVRQKFGLMPFQRAIELAIERASEHFNKKEP